MMPKDKDVPVFGWDERFSTHNTFVRISSDPPANKCNLQYQNSQFLVVTSQPTNGGKLS